MKFKCSWCKRETELKNGIVVYMCPCGKIHKIKKGSGSNGL